MAAAAFDGVAEFAQAAKSWPERRVLVEMMVADKRLLELIKNEVDSKMRCHSEAAYLTPSRLSPGNYAKYVKKWAGTEEYQLSEDEQAAFDSWAAERAKDDEDYDEDGEPNFPARPHWELMTAKIAAILLVQHYNDVLGEKGSKAIDEQMDALDNYVAGDILETAGELASEQCWGEGHNHTWNSDIDRILEEKHFRFLPSQLHHVESKDYDLRRSVMIRGSRMEYKGECFESLFKLAHYKEFMQEIKDKEDAATEAGDDEHVSATEDEGEEEEEDEEPAVGQKRKREAIPADADVIDVC